MSAIDGAEVPGGGGGEGGVRYEVSGSSVARRQNSPDSNSEHEPSTKKQLKVYLDGPPEDEETAEKKLADAGFDRGNYTEVHDFGEDFMLSETADNSFTRYSTPLIHFCRQGDIKMCRYLLQKGASVHEKCTGAPSEEDLHNLWNPMYAASVALHNVVHEVRFDICKLLFTNGAPINQCNDSNFTPLRIWARQNTKKRVKECKWFIVNGALTGVDGKISESALRRDIAPISYLGPLRWEVRTDLLSWAEEALQTHRAFEVFLLGTFPSPRSRQNQSTHLTGFSGKAGILEHIGNYVGVARGRDLRMFRQLAPLLARYISDTPYEPEAAEDGVSV